MGDTGRSYDYGPGAHIKNYSRPFVSGFPRKKHTTVPIWCNMLSGNYWCAEMKEYRCWFDNLETSKAGKVEINWTVDSHTVRSRRRWDQFMGSFWKGYLRNRRVLTRFLVPLIQPFCLPVSS